MGGIFESCAQEAMRSKVCHAAARNGTVSILTLPPISAVCKYPDSIREAQTPEWFVFPSEVAAKLTLQTRQEPGPMSHDEDLQRRVELILTRFPVPQVYRSRY
jgi:hypothetical protein